MTSKTKAKLRRIVKSTLVAIVSLWALYIVAANVFLSSSLFDKAVNGEPDVVWIKFERGFTIIPGRIHARNLHIQSSDSNVDWVLRVDRVSFDVSLIDLLRKRFYVEHVDGTGVTFRMRLKKPAPRLTEDVVAHYPPIPGYGRLPIRPPDPPSPAVWNDDAWDLWTVRLGDVTARDVREIWIDGARWQGSLGASGGFYLKPIRRAEIGWIDLRVDRGTLAIDAKPALASISGTARLKVDGFDPRTTHGEAFVHLLSMQSDLRFVVPDVEAFSVPNVHGPLIANRLALVIDRGKLADGAHAVITVPHATAMIDRLRIDGAGSFDASVSGTNLVLRSVLHDVTFGNGALQMPSVVTYGEARDLDLLRLSDLHLTTTIPQATLPDARALNVLPGEERISFMEGAMEANGVIESWPTQHRASGHGEVVASALDVRVAKVHVNGSTHMIGSFGMLHFDQRRIEDVKLDATITKGHVAGPDGKPIVGFGDLSLEAQAKTVDLDDPLRALDARLAIEDGSIEAKNFFAAYLPKGKELAVDRTHARFTAEAELTIEDHLGRGQLVANAPKIGFTYGALGLTADLRARARVHDWAWEKGDVVVDEATVGAHRIVITKRTAPKDALLTIDRIAITGSSPRFSFEDPLQRSDLHARIEGGRVPDARALDAFLPAGSTFGLVSKDGTFEAELDASVEKRVAHATVHTRSRRLGASGAKLRVLGDLDLYATIDHWDLDRNVLALEDTRIVMTGIEGSFARDVEAPDFTARGIALTGRSARFDLAHPTLSGFDFRLAVDNASLPDARSLSPFLPDGTVAIDSGRATANADVRVSSSEKTASGGIAIDLDGRVRVRDTTLAGAFGIVAEVNGWNPEEDRLDVARSRVIARDVHLNDSEAPWNGVLVVERGTVRLNREPAFDADIVLDAKDATPIAELAASGIPQPFAGLVKAPKLHATANITIAPKLIALRDVDAKGGDVALRGSFIARGDRKRGAFIIEKGPFSAGVRIDEGGASPRLFGLEGWLDREERSASQLLDADSRKAKRPAR